MTTAEVVVQPRLSVEPLERVARTRYPSTTGHERQATPLSRMLDTLGLSRKQGQRWAAEGGVPLEWAEHVAWLLGEHPSYLWPEYWTVCGV